MAKSDQVAEQLSQLLASTYVLYVKTQNFHWNVTGANFKSLHELFEEQYDDLAEAVDDLAERLRAMGYAAPGTMAQFLKLSQIQEAPQKDLSADEMLTVLAEDQDKLVQVICKTRDVAEANDDDVTADMMDGRQTVHEKNAWMLRASMSKKEASGKRQVA